MRLTKHSMKYQQNPQGETRAEEENPHVSDWLWDRKCNKRVTVCNTQQQMQHNQDGREKYTTSRKAGGRMWRSSKQALPKTHVKSKNNTYTARIDFCQLQHDHQHRTTFATDTVV